MYISLRLRAMLIPTIILVVLLAVGTVSKMSSRVEMSGGEEAILTEGKNTQSDCYRVLVKTFLTDIQAMTYDYYNSYIDIQPTVDFDSVKVERIYSDKSKDFIVFSCEPYIGAHNTIGIEEILFSADVQGNVSLVNFTHIKGFPLPDHLRGHIKNDYPMQEQ